jgi:DNA-directed RNA polymerase subunit H (RpoH/RPB5)
MLKKEIWVLFFVLIAILGCKHEDIPKEIISKENMIGLLVDMHITDAYLNQVSNNDTLQMEAKARYNFIFKQHHTDSVKFSRSLKYYSLRSKDLNDMYKKVMDSLDVMQKGLHPKPKFKKRIKSKVLPK